VYALKLIVQTVVDFVNYQWKSPQELNQLLQEDTKKYPEIAYEMIKA
jgi:hypothetical protein